ncbi:hypothetical protein [Nonomuraea sp. NPDC049129]|uniref:hypothetical protein n=1 Tax=Nonomuraea sp. NPDC049129 TaxID=3155272 RepID=UPI0033CDBDF3
MRSNVAGLIWTEQAINWNESSGAALGTAAIFTTYLATAQTDMTVNARSGYFDSGGLQVYVVTGADPTTPVGKVATGSTQQTGTTVHNAFTTTKAGTLTIGVVNDWNARSTPAVDSSATSSPWFMQLKDSGSAFYKNALAAAPNQAISFELTTGANPAHLRWAAVEILPGPDVLPFSGWGIPIF